MSTLRSRIPRAVIALGVVSLLTDLSSEMIYPLLPIFLGSVLGAGAMALGVIVNRPVASAGGSNTEGDEKFACEAQPRPHWPQ